MSSTALTAAGITSAALSIVGSAAIIASYFVWKDLRTTIRRLLVYLSVSDLVTALFNLIGLLTTDQSQQSDSKVCIAQSFFNTWSAMSSFWWTLAIAIYLYLCIVKRRVEPADKLVPWFHLFAWFLPGIFVVIGVSFGALGYDSDFSSGWCWIRTYSSERETLFWHLFEGKALEIATIVLTPIIYIAIKYDGYTKKRRESEIETPLLINRDAVMALHDTDKKLTWIPIIFVVLRVWGTVRFLMNANQLGSGDLYFLRLLQNIGDSAQGFANAILYCLFTARVRKHIAALFGCATDG